MSYGIYNHTQTTQLLCFHSQRMARPTQGQKNSFIPRLQVSKYSKTCVTQPLSKRLKIGFQDQISINAGQKYCRMLQMEHSAILSTFIKLPFVIKIFVLS